MNRIILVGGTWDNKRGKPSKIITIMYNALVSEGKNVTMYNGGSYPHLNRIQVYGADIIMWFPNIPNHLDKELDIKKTFPKIILVTSKNNVGERYSFQEIIAHGLASKSNLILEIFDRLDKYWGQLMDPLGNVWLEPTNDFALIAKAIVNRVNYLKSITRRPTVWSPEAQETLLPTDENEKFLKFIQKSADTFHKLISPAKGIERFLGNASFRCIDGFPSLISPNGCIYMSRRNIDKRSLALNQFVQVGCNPDKDITWYRGDYKPSVDTVIQIQLYQHLTFNKIKYMIHSHVYVEHAPFTENMVPCGGLEEVYEILKVIKDHKVNTESAFALNLIGHGSLICAKMPKDFEKFKYIKRVVPEIMNNTPLQESIKY
jgi:hypothetical protein